MFTAVQSSWQSKLGKSLLLVIGFTCSVSSSAESLLDVYRLALTQSPEYMAGVYQRGASSETFKQARSFLLPQVNFKFDQTETTQDIVSSDNQVFGAGKTSFPVDETSLSITQSIYSFVNWARYSQSKVELKRIDAEFMGVQQDLIFNVAVVYFAALSTHEDLLSIKSETRALEQHLNLVRAKRSEGLVRKTELLDVQARFLQAQARELAVLAALRDALQGLRELTGELPASLKLLDKDLPLNPPDPQDPEEWLITALEYNPEIKQSKEALESARQEVRVQKGGRYPTLDLQFNLNDRTTEGTLFGGGSEVKTQDITLEVSMPIYSGGAVSSRIREAVQEYSKAQQTLEGQLRDVRRKVYSNHDAILTDIAKIQALNKSVEAYELAVSAKTLAYESGITTSLAVLDAERDLFIARNQHVRARYDYIINTLRLKRAVGLINENDLVQVDSWLGGGESKLVAYVP